MEKYGVKMYCVLAVLLSTLLIPVVQATPPTTVEGKWSYLMTVDSARLAGGNLFLKVTETGIWEGGFEGTSTMVVSGVLHSNGYLNFQGVIYFDGSVLGKVGTLVISYTGKVTPTSEIISQWVIQSGTGGLANLRGQGTFSGVGAIDLLYSGQVHFKPD